MYQLKTLAISASPTLSTLYSALVTIKRHYPRVSVGVEDRPRMTTTP
jgi:hypothetical protein